MNIYAKILKYKYKLSNKYYNYTVLGSKDKNDGNLNNSKNTDEIDDINSTNKKIHIYTIMI